MGITRTLRVISSAALTGALVFATASPAAADRVRDDQWALKSLDAESIWKITKGQGQTVAVIDVGVNADHPDLKGNVTEGKDFFDSDIDFEEEGKDHGTNMAGIIAGHGHGAGGGSGVMGLAPEAKILSVRANGADKDQLSGAIKYAADHGASVINISQADDSQYPEVADAVGYALKKDALIVAGTGNEGKAIGYPAAYPGAVAVGAVNEDGKIWEKSNRGEQTLLSAPGAGVVTTGGPSNINGYGIGDGTSDSTAYTSAAAALVRAKYPDLTAGQVANRLVKTAEKPASESAGRDDRYGYGAIRPLAALQEDIPKGSKFGPLSVPDLIKDEAGAAQQDEESQALEEQADRKFVIIWSVIGAVGLLFVGGLVALVVRMRRKKQSNNGPGGPGTPGPGSYPPGQAPGYGVPPQQQPTAPRPQQPPFN